MDMDMVMDVARERMNMNPHGTRHLLLRFCLRLPPPLRSVLSRDLRGGQHLRACGRWRAAERGVGAIGAGHGAAHRAAARVTRGPLLCNSGVAARPGEATALGGLEVVGGELGA